MYERQVCANNIQEIQCLRTLTRRVSISEQDKQHKTRRRHAKVTDDIYMYQSKSERGLQIKYTELQEGSTRGMIFKGHKDEGDRRGKGRGKRLAFNGSIGAISSSPAVALVGGDSRDDYAEGSQCRCYPRDNVRVVGRPYEWPRSELSFFYQHDWELKLTVAGVEEARIARSAILIGDDSERDHSKDSCA